MLACDARNRHVRPYRAMRNACSSENGCGLVCDGSVGDAKSLAMCFERCGPLSHLSSWPFDLEMVHVLGHRRVFKNLAQLNSDWPFQILLPFRPRYSNGPCCSILQPQNSSNTTHFKSRWTRLLWEKMLTHVSRFRSPPSSLPKLLHTHTHTHMGIDTQGHGHTRTDARSHARTNTHAHTDTTHAHKQTQTQTHTHTHTHS